MANYETINAKIHYQDGTWDAVAVREDGTISFSPEYLAELIKQKARDDYREADVAIGLSTLDVSRIFGKVEIISYKKGGS